MYLLLRCLVVLLVLLAPTRSVAQDDDDKIVYDPAPKRIAFPETLPYSALNGVHHRLTLYSFGSSPFLMTSSKQNNNDVKDNVTVIDLLTGKAVGVLRNLAMSGRPTFATDRLALSGDGLLLAQYHPSSNGIRLIDVKAAKVQRVLPLKASNVILFFTQPDRLLALCTDTGKERGMVWEISTGKELQFFRLPSDMETNAGQVGVSPGGRLLAIPEGDQRVIGSNHLGLYDLTTGKKLRDFWASNRPTPPGVMFKAVSFSPDGKELAAIVQLPHPVNSGATLPNIVIWDFATGKRLTKTVIERGNRGGLILSCVDPLQWFPDQQAFLINQQFVVNREDGKQLDYIQGEGSNDAHFATRVLDDRRVFVAASFNKLAIRTVKR